MSLIKINNFHGELQVDLTENGLKNQRTKRITASRKGLMNFNFLTHKSHRLVSYGWILTVSAIETMTRQDSRYIFE